MRLLSPHTRLHSKTPEKVSSLRAYFSFSKAKSRRNVMAGALCLVVFISLGVIMPASQAMAATKTSTLSPSDQASSFAYYKALHSCMASGWYKESGGLVKQGYMQQKDAVSFNWFNGKAGLSSPSNGINVGAFNDPRGTNGDGQQNCGDADGSIWIAKAAKLWGYDSGPQLLCDLGFKRDSNIPCTSITDGSNNFTAPDDAPARLDTLWKNTLGSQSTELDGITKLGGAYALYLNNFQSQCRPVGGGTGYSIQIFGQGSTTPTTTSFGAGDTSRNSDYKVTIYDSKQMSCGDLAKAISDPNSAVVIGYQAYLKAHKGVDPGGVAAPGCTTGTASANCDTDSASSCLIDGVGWIVCTAATFLASVTDKVYNLVKQMLTVQPLNVNVNDGNNGVYNAWTVMRSLANVVFVILFLIIIFSQLTGGGVSNYGVKKTLPKLVVAALLVNVSYWIGAVAVDISNILGSGIYDLLSGVKDRMNIGISQNWGNIMAGLLGGSAIAISGGAIVVGSAALATGLTVAAGPEAMIAVALMALPLLLGAVLAVLIVAFVLIARQALIVLLILVSPLAFAAMLLPNTERYFKQWVKLLTTMLTMYPLVSVIFGGAQIAGLALMSTAATGDNATTTAIAIVSGQLVMVIPFFFLFTLINKFSGSELGGLAGKIRASGSKAVNNIRSKSKPLADRKFGLAKNRVQNGEVRRRYNRNGQETGMSRLGGVGSTIAGGLLNGAGQSKMADEINAKAGQEDIQRRYQESAPVVVAENRLKTSQLQSKISEAAANTHFEATAPLALKLRAKLAEERLELEKGNTKRAGVEAATLYSQSMRTGDATVAAAAAARAGGDIAIAHGLHEAHTASTTGSEATNIASRLQQIEFAKEIENNPALLSSAAGIGGPRAESSVLASAKSVNAEAASKAIAAEKTLLSTTAPADLVTRYQDASLSDEARAAAVGRLMQVGTDDQIYSAIDYSAAQSGTSSGTLLQQQLVADMGSRKPISLGGATLSQMQTGTFNGSFSDIVKNRLQSGKIGAASASSATADELKQMLSSINTMPVKGPELQKLRDDINSHLANKNITQPTPEITDLMEQIANAV